MSSSKNILRELRKEYTKNGLRKRDVAESPCLQFHKWFSEALKAEIAEPNAMTLSTAGKSGQPSARIVLLKDFNEQGFQFYTNYSSRKGMDIQENPLVSLSFFWQELERQVRI